MSETTKKSDELPNPDRVAEDRQKKAIKAELEADVAYFEARLELIGKPPETSNRKAQQVMFEALSAQVQDQIKKVDDKKT